MKVKFFAGNSSKQIKNIKREASRVSMWACVSWLQVKKFLRLLSLQFDSSCLPVRTLWLIEEIRRWPAIAPPIRHLEFVDKKNFMLIQFSMVWDDLMRLVCLVDMQKNTQIIAVHDEGRRLIIILRARKRDDSATIIADGNCFDLESVSRDIVKNQY